jgi:hypothetical protein
MVGSTRVLQTPTHADESVSGESRDLDLRRYGGLTATSRDGIMRNKKTAATPP